MITQIENRKTRRPRAYQRIVAQIRKDVFARRLLPGDRLPEEAGLAARFNVSRAVVREALRVLELQGLVHVEHGFRGGAFLAESDGQPVVRALETMLHLKKIDRAEIYAARRYLEPGVAALAARNRDEDALKILRENVAECEQRLSDTRPAFLTNLKFHSLLAEACGNPIIGLMTETLLEFLREAESRIPSDIQSNREACRMHKAILDAVEDGDARKAESEMARHLAWLEQHFAKTRKVKR